MIKYAGIGVFAFGVVAFAVRETLALVMPIAKVPEPALLLLLGIGLLTLGIVTRRKLPLI